MRREHVWGCRPLANGLAGMEFLLGCDSCHFALAACQRCACLTGRLPISFWHRASEPSSGDVTAGGELTDLRMRPAFT